MLVGNEGAKAGLRQALALRSPGRVTRISPRRILIGIYSSFGKPVKPSAGRHFAYIYILYTPNLHIGTLIRNLIQHVILLSNE